MAISSPNGIFTGRVNEIRKITDIFKKWMGLLEDDGTQTPQVHLLQINGVPGIGKTTFMKKVVEELQDEERSRKENLTSHYINLEGLSDIYTLRTKLMFSLRPSGGGFVNFARLEDYHLVVFDHVETVAGTGDRDLQTDFQLLCEEMVDKTGNIMVVLISRFQLKFLRLDRVFCSMKLLPLSPEESQHLLENLIPEIDIEEEDLDEMVRLCEGIPLALILIARILQSETVKPDDLCSILRENQARALEQTDADTKPNLQGVVQTSIEQLTVLLKTHYATLSYFPGDFGMDAAIHVLGMGSTAVAKQDAVLPLAKRSLLSLETSDTPQRVSIHAYLRDFMEQHHSGLRNEEYTRNRYCEFYAVLVKRLAPLVEANNCKKLPLFIQEIHNIEKLLKEAVNCSQEHYNLFIQLAYHAEYLLTNFFGKESVQFYEACVNSAAAYAEAHNDPRNLGLMLSSYGQVLGFIASDFEGAYKAYMESKEILEPLGDSEDLAWLYSHIGFNFHDRGLDKEAIEWLHKALGVNRRFMKKLKTEEKDYIAVGKEVPDSLRDRIIRTERLTCSNLASLGIVHCCTGSYSLSEKFSKESRDRRQTMWGMHPVIGSMNNNLSHVYFGQGDDDKGFECAFRGLQIKMQFDARPSHANVDSLCNVAMQYCCRGNDVEAMKLVKKAHQMIKRLGLQHKNASLVYTCFGEVYSLLEDFEEALKWHEKAVRHRSENLGPSHPFTAEALHCHGNTLMKAGQYELALEKLGKCLEIRKEAAKTVTTPNIGIAWVLENMGDTFSKKGDREKAKDHYGLSITELQSLRKIFDEKDEEKNVNQTEKEIERLRELQECMDSGREPTIKSERQKPLNCFSLSW